MELYSSLQFLSTLLEQVRACLADSPVHECAISMKQLKLVFIHPVVCGAEVFCGVSAQHHH